VTEHIGTGEDFRGKGRADREAAEENYVCLRVYLLGAGYESYVA
jgi:hypothetical protein